MKRTTIFAALLALFVTSGLAQRPPTLTDDDIVSPKTTKPKEESAKPNAPAGSIPVASGNWVEVAPDGGGFKITMPGRPTTNTQTQELPVLGKVDHHMLQVADGSSVYQLTYFHLPKSEMVDTNSATFRAAFLTSLAQGLAKGVQGELVSETAISQDGTEGREVQVKIQAGVVWSRLFLINGTMYSLSVLSNGKEGDGKTRFFNSFKTK